MSSILLCLIAISSFTTLIEKVPPCLKYVGGTEGCDVVSSPCYNWGVFELGEECDTPYRSRTSSQMWDKVDAATPTGYYPESVTTIVCYRKAPCIYQIDDFGSYFCGPDLNLVQDVSKIKFILNINDPCGLD